MILDYEPPEPKLWKALLIVAPIVAIIAWSVHSRSKMPVGIVILLAVIATLAVATTIHYRVLNDWRSRGLRRSMIDRSPRTPPYKRVDRNRPD